MISNAFLSSISNSYSDSKSSFSRLFTLKWSRVHPVQAAIFEVSRITKFILDRGAVITTEIISGHYRRSPLVQGGLEVPCKAIVNTPPSFNMDVLKKYEDLVQELYVEPRNEEIIGTVVLLYSQNDRSSQDREENHSQSRKKERPSTSITKKTEVKSRDIWDLFNQAMKMLKKKGEMKKKLKSSTWISCIVAFFILFTDQI